MPEPTPTLIRSQPGIKRDGTQLDGDNYTDALWCRFQRGLPKKMGGFRAVTSTIPELTYGMQVSALNGVQYVHLGGQSTLIQILTDVFGNVTGQSNRIPGGFATNINNLWQFETLFDTTGGLNRLIAHAAPNLAMIDSNVETPVYFGTLSAAAALTATALGSHSGGIVSLEPFLLAFGNSGKIVISTQNDPSAAILNTAYIAGSKIVRGLPLRGGGTGPSGIFWSLDSVIRATFTSLTTGVFAFDDLSSQSSVLSSRSIIEYDGVYFWIGIDRFLVFNGVVRTLVNNMNFNWFFDNLNFQQRQKVFAFKVPKYKEIWWCFPFGTATECTHAIIYNVEGQFWYDTMLPIDTQAGMGRTDGAYPGTYPNPFMPDQVNTGTGFTLWQHETGSDSINATSVQPIRSFFQTSEMSFLNQNLNRSTDVSFVEPDFNQSGDITMTVTGRQNARSPEVASSVYTISGLIPTAVPEQQNIPLREIRRLMSFKFESNTLGGKYELGKTFAHITPADGRMRS